MTLREYLDIITSIKENTIMIILPNPITNTTSNLRGPASITISEQVVGSQEYLPGGKTINVSSGKHRWVATVKYDNISDEEYRLIDATLRKARMLGEPVGIITETALDLHVLGDTKACKVSQGKTKAFIEVTKLEGLMGSPYLGDFIQLSGSTKVYKLIDLEITSDKWILMIDPVLDHEIVEGEKINFNPILYTKVEGTELESATLGLNNLYDSLSYKFVECIE